MVIAALKTLTWGTLAAAVISALLLALAGGNFPRIASITGDAALGRLSATNPPTLVGQSPGATNEAPHAAASARDGSSH